MAKIGIDISSHQKDINLEALKDQIDFVIIRVGFGVNGTIDNRFIRNIELCQKLNIPVGFYWYSYALDIEGAKKEAEHFLKIIAPYNPTYGCWFDMEDADGYKKRNGMPSNTMLQDICYTFCDIVESAGYYTGIYASESWLKNQLDSSKLARFDKWTAQWPTSKGVQKGLLVSSDARTGLSMWQFTSAGRFDGYNGNLDVNYAYKNFPNPKPSTVVTEPPKPTQPTVATIRKGSKVRFVGTASYSGVKLAAWTYEHVFNVIEVSGNRVVIGKGSAVTAAVNIKDCKPI